MLSIAYQSATSVQAMFDSRRRPGCYVRTSCRAFSARTGAEGHSTTRQVSTPLCIRLNLFRREMIFTAHSVRRRCWPWFGAGVLLNGANRGIVLCLYSSTRQAKFLSCAIISLEWKSTSNRLESTNLCSADSPRKEELAMKMQDGIQEWLI